MSGLESNQGNYLYQSSIRAQWYAFGEIMPITESQTDLTVGETDTTSLYQTKFNIFKSKSQEAFYKHWRKKVHIHLLPIIK